MIVTKLPKLRQNGDRYFKVSFFWVTSVPRDIKYWTSSLETSTQILDSDSDSDGGN